MRDHGKKFLCSCFIFKYEIMKVLLLISYSKCATVETGLSLY